MTDSHLDPQLLQAQPPYILPLGAPHQSRSPPHSALEVRSEQEQQNGTAGGKKRVKMNLYKCEQCRAARKKCFPENRTWPQKCDRCKNHKPHELECSAPSLNTNKRGPNKKPTQTKGVHSHESRQTGAPSDDESDQSEESAPKSERPGPTLVRRKVKTEYDDETKESSAVTKKQKVTSKHFRLLEVQAGPKTSPIVCSVTTACFDDDEIPEYEAVSYYWGGLDTGKKDSKAIDLEGREIYVRRNLYNALHNLRSPDRPRKFWIDALCIDHLNQKEKNEQVNNKPRIFHNAFNQCFWLGDDNNDKLGLGFIHEILNLANINILVRDAQYIDRWRKFASLLKNVAFTRLWMVQEVTMAPNTSLHCGEVSISYKDFVEATAMFFSCRDDLVNLFREEKQPYMELMDRRLFVTKTFIDVSQNAMRVLGGKGSETERRLSLESLVSMLSELACGEHRDRIYSVLSLAKDGLPPPAGTHFTKAQKNSIDMEVRYDRSILEVYKDFVIHVITVSNSLNIICRTWASAVPERGRKGCLLPTWIRPLQSPFQPPFDTDSSERRNADSLVGLPSKSCYDASRSIPFKFDQNDLPHMLSGSGTLSPLKVKGIKIQTITQLGPRASEGNIMLEWLQLGGYKLRDEVDEVPERFWRTLVADRGPHCDVAQPWYHRALLYCLIDGERNADMNTTNLIAKYDTESKLVVGFLRRVQSVVWNRKFLVCGNKDRGKDWVGLAPMAADIGDVVCVLYGCSVPVVLRQVGQYWQVVGECYVHGIMDGEAIDPSVSDAEALDSAETFELI